MEHLDKNLAYHEAAHAVAFALMGADYVTVRAETDIDGYYCQVNGWVANRGNPCPMAMDVLPCVAGAAWTALFDDRTQSLELPDTLGLGGLLVNIGAKLGVCQEDLVMLDRLDAPRAEVTAAVRFMLMLGIANPQAAGSIAGDIYAGLQGKSFPAYMRLDGHSLRQQFPYADHLRGLSWVSRLFRTTPARRNLVRQLTNMEVRYA